MISESTAAAHAATSDLEADLAVVTALHTLPHERWQVWSDVAWIGRRHARGSHVVVGPGGVFVVTTKNWPGLITARQGVLRHDGRVRETPVADAYDAAEAVRALTRPVPPELVWPVLCFAQATHVVGRARDVFLCSTGNVTSTLEGHPDVLSPAEVGRVGRDLGSVLDASGGRRTAAGCARCAATVESSLSE